MVNVMVFLAQTLLNYKTPLGNIDELFSLHYHKSTLYRPFQIITHMFLHANFLHLLFNMWGLWMFGVIIEKVWGSKRFLFFYLICGVGAAFAQMLWYSYSFNSVNLADVNSMEYFMAEHTAAVGASGAIMGIMAAFAYLFGNTELIIIPIPFPVKAKWAILGFFLIDVFGGFANVEGDNIAHFAHIGGAIVGFFLTLYWNKTKKTFY